MGQPSGNFLTRVGFVGLACVLFQSPVLAANVQNLSLVDQRLQEVERQLEQMAAHYQKEIEALNQKIKVLKNTKPKNREAEITSSSPALAEKVEELENSLEILSTDLESVTQTLQDRVKLNLYATLEFESFQHSKPVFDARNIELFADVTLNDRLRAFAEIEFERTAKTSSGARQGEVEVEQGWLEFMINEYVKPRAGVILVPFGRFNLEHFDPVRDLTDRPVAMRRVIPVTWAEAGAGFTGSAFLGEALEGTIFDELSVDYQFFVMNGLTNAISDRGTRSARGAFGSDNNANKALAGRIQTNLVEGVEVAGSGYMGTYDSKGHSIYGWNTDWKFSYGPIEFIGEYAWFELERGGLQSGSTTLMVPQHLHGGYLQANYHFWFNALNNSFLGRGFPSPTFTGVVRYGHARISDDNDAGTGANKEKRVTLGVNYRPIENVVFKMEYQFNDTTNESLERGDNNGFITSVTGAF